MGGVGGGGRGMLGGTFFPFIDLVSTCFSTPLLFDLLFKKKKKKKKKKKRFIYTGFAKKAICHVKSCHGKKCGNKPSKY